MNPYTPDFFEAERRTSAAGAAVILPLVVGHYQPRSMVDVGCGAGEWVRRARALGLAAVGVDGPWAPDPDVKADLNYPLAHGGKYDLAVCLETAEHLSPRRADGLVAELCELAPIVLWSAALPGQTGEGHVNERPWTYWRDLFAAHGMRPDFWVNRVLIDRDVPSWYKRVIVYSRQPTDLPVFESLNVAITLRCNSSCRNCIRLCNSTVTTGLDYRGLDMTLADVDAICDDIARVHAEAGRTVFDSVCVTGGEPTLHPQLSAIWARFKERLTPAMVHDLTLNTNRTRPVPAEIEPHVVHWWSVDEKPLLHQCALVSPTDPPPGFPSQGGRTWETCSHFRRDRLVATVHGYQLCCAAEGYTRLLHLPELLTGRLPASLDGMPRPDPVCQHCAFGAPVAFAERDHGRPVSPVFDAAAALNRKGRRMPEKLRGEP